MSAKNRNIIIGCSVGIIICIVLCWSYYHYYHLIKSNFVSTDGQEHSIYIYPNTTTDDIPNILAEHYEIKSLSTYNSHSKWLSFSYPEVGHYTLPANLGNRELIHILKYGRQSPISFTFNNIRTVEQLSSKIGNQLLLDSASVDSLLRDSLFLASYGLSDATSMLFFIPNTYDVYWTISPTKLFERMQNEYTHFWNSRRRSNAQKINLNPTEVSILASIVEEENSSKPDEWPRIAGLYINRLKIGMPLQADPTVKFAVGDFSISRVLNIHLAVESPYNTYLVTGLPPGPIRVPSARAIDAVLNAEKHNYLYMCADYQLTGYHRFTNSPAEHAHNAQLYRQQLNKMKIYK